MSVTANKNTMAADAASGTCQVTVATLDGNGIAPGDTIIAHCVSNGTHASLGMTVQDSVNATNFTNDKEQQLGGSSALWQQASRYVVANAIPDGSTITLTGYAGATETKLAVTVIRYSLGTIAQAFVSQPNASNTSQATPALGAAPVRGSFVMTFDAAANAGSGLTPGAGFTLDSADSHGSASLANAYATADGVSTYASTWTDSTGAAVSATMTVAYTAASVGMPYLIARANAAAGSNTLVATVGSPVGAASVSGDNIYAGILLPNTTNAPTTVVDNHARSWAQKANFPAGNGLTLYFYELLNATTVLALGDTLTATFSNTLLGKAMFVVGCAGMNHTADLDPTSPDTASGAGTSASMSTGTGVLANNNELMLGLVGAGSAAGDVIWPSDWTELGQVQTAAGGVYLSVGAKVVYANDPVNVAATLTNSAIWAGMLLGLTPDPPAGAAASVQITDGSPLPAATVGVPYSYGPLNVQGGTKPYTFTESGSLPSGITLSPGSQGGSTAITHVGAMGGPDGASGNDMSYEDAAQSTIGPLTACKLFYGGDLPSSWTALASGSSALSPASLVAKYPKCIPVVCWNGPNPTATNPPPSSAATIAKFCSSIPAGQVVGFAWQQEPENPTSKLDGPHYVSGMQTTADAIHALHRPELIVMANATWGQYMGSGGRGYDGSFLPPAYDGTKGCVDCYCMDIYQHQAGGTMFGQTTWPSQGLANHAGFQRWLTLVKKLADPVGVPLGINEYGVDDTGSVAARNARIQQDYAYIQSAFNGGAASSKPLFTWCYWWHTMAQSNTHYKFTDAATIATWKGIAAGNSSGGGSTGGVFSGTPGPSSAGTYASIAVTAHDANGVASSPKTFSLTVSAASSLSWVTTSPLSGATVAAPYNFQFQAQGGKTPYVFSLHAGSVLPTGWTLTSAGVLSGTTAVTGTASFSVDCTDANSAVITLACTVLISSGLSIATTDLPPGIVGTAYLVTLATQGGTAPFSWGLAPDSGGLAPGLAIDPDLGTITGDPSLAGAYPVDLQVTDAGGATATQTLTLTIAQPTGGLPPIGRRRFGGSMGDWVFTFFGDQLDRASGVTITFYDALTGGSPVSELTTILGAPITSVTSDANGEIPEFYGPDGVTELYADANGGLGPRRRMLASDLPDLVVAMYGALKTLTG